MSTSGLDVLGNFIDGSWQTAPERMPAINPANGETIAWLPKSDRATAGRAIAAAKAAQPAWAARSVWQRADMCAAIAAKIDEKRDHIARILSAEQGKPLAQAVGEVAKAADGFRLAGELVKQMRGETLPAEDPSKLVITLRQPRGVYAVITPWNYPVNIPTEYLAPGIATGNAIVWVPAPTTSMAAVELMRAIEAAGLPAGVVTISSWARGPWWATRSSPIRIPTASASPVVLQPDSALPNAAPASRCCSNSAATAPCWCSRMPISIVPPPRRRAAPFPMPARSAPQRAACSPIAASSSRWPKRSPNTPRIMCSAIPCIRVPRWGR
jgi:hypothetical protein